jgi:hypothetical protein
MSQRNHKHNRSTKMIYFGIATLMIVLLHSTFAGAALLQERNSKLPPADEDVSASRLAYVQQAASVNQPMSVNQLVSVGQQKDRITSFQVENRRAATDLDRTGRQWEVLEWSVENSTYSGNPFDLIAEVTFEHQGSNELRRTQMFYAGENTWKFRFTGTEPGEWRFNSQSSAAALNGLSGAVTVAANPQGRGFVTHYDDKWGWSGTGEVFVPQFVMYRMLHHFYDQPELMIDEDIEEFLYRHGFNGLHVPNIAGAWFDGSTATRRIDSSMQNPDIRTFEALEMLIGKVYAAGGSVHIWAWGDEGRRQTPIGLQGGINGPVDQRLQRYIAARLGPLPGWTMGYGFDLWEWVQGPQLTTWHEYMHRHMGWPHLLGGRASKNMLNQLSEDLDYSGYEQHQPDYATYVETILKRPGKPSFSEDRFRISTDPRKDYDMQMTRRGLYHSTMAGGVANIWGNLSHGATSATGSAPYPNPEWIKTYATVFKQRFTRDLQRCPGLSDGVCLKRPNNKDFIFYKEDTASIRMDLAQMDDSQPAVAIDTKLAYAEINIGNLSAAEQTWSAPYASDWVVVVGTFAQADNPLPDVTPTPTSTPTPLPTPISTPPPTAEPLCPSSQEALITNIKVSSDRVYELDELAPDRPLYIDRDYRISSIPAYLSGALLIRTANADKTSDNLDHLQFELSMPATLYIAYDERATVLPAWMNAGWEATGESLTTTDGVLNLYHKQADCGEVVLGGNAVPPMTGADTNYVVIVHTQVGEDRIYLPFLNR